MMTKRFLTLLMSGILVFGCKKIVEFEDPTPVEVSYCQSTEYFRAQWFTDSVWITTEVDTLDSLIVNRAPGIRYFLDVQCSDTASQLQMIYASNAGVQTLDLQSTNFKATNNAINVFGQLDSLRTESQFVIAVDSTSDSTFTGSYSRELGNGQRSNYQLFFRK
jgi:hypothetical protein